MAKGVEMMLANMIGIKPDELMRAFNATVENVGKVTKDIADIKIALARIEEHIAQENAPLALVPFDSQDGAHCNGE